MELSPVRDHNCLLRTHLLELDEKLGVKLSLDQPWFYWLVEFVADIHNRHQVGQDGKTPYVRLRGRDSHAYIQKFGRQVMRGIPGNLTGGLMQARWYSGTYLGVRHESGEIIVSMPDGSVVKARDFREVPDNVAWVGEQLELVRGTPYDHAGTLDAQTPGDDEQLPVIPELRPVDQKENNTRGLPLRERHFKIIGYTDGCIKCRKMQRNERSSDGHSPDCRRRALRLLMESDEFRDEVIRAEARMEEALARELERTVSMEQQVRQEPSAGAPQ